MTGGISLANQAIPITPASPESFNLSHTGCTSHSVNAKVSDDSLSAVHTVSNALTPMDRLGLGLQEIADKPMFCTFRFVRDHAKPGKVKKIPYLRGGKAFSVRYDDPLLPTMLMKLEEAISECTKLGHDVPGIVFTPDCGVIGVDLDHCLDSDRNLTATPAQKAALVLVKDHAFLERSQSGTGLHAIMLGSAPTVKANGELEVFGNKNAIALTGEAGKGIAKPIDSDRLNKLLKIVSEIQKNGATKINANSLILRTQPIKVNADAANADLLAHCAPVGLEPIERVEDALRFIDPDCAYDQWRDSLWAIRNALGDTPETLALADKWSSGALHNKKVNSYTGDQSIHSVLDSYDTTREGAITVGTMYHFAKLGGWQGYETNIPDEAVHQKTDDASDLALSNVFVQNHKHKFKRDHSARKWRKFNGACWELCEKAEQVEAMKHCVAVILRMAAKELAKNQESTKGKKLLALAVRAQNEKGISAALKLAESDPAVAVAVNEFDKDPDLFNTTNCVIHLPTGTVIPHEPGQMLSKQSPVAYDPSAQCPNFMRFMEQISCDDPEWIDYQQRALGYMLSGRVHEEKMFFWFGDPPHCINKSVTRRTCCLT